MTLRQSEISLLLLLLLQLLLFLLHVEVCKASDNGACIISVRAKKDAIVAFCFAVLALGVDGGVNFTLWSFVTLSRLNHGLPRVQS